MLRTIFRKKRLFLTSIIAVSLLLMAIPLSAQDGENFCRSAISQRVEYGQTVTGLIDASVPVAFYCFDGSRGDEVTVEVTATSDRLVPAIFISDPVFNPEDEAIAYGEATSAGGDAEVTFVLDANDTYLIVVTSIENTLGSFEMSIDAESSGGFNPNNVVPTQDPDENNNSSSGNNNSTSAEEIVLGETNFCRLDITETIEYNSEVSGTIEVDFPLAVYCFEASAGDLVSVEAGTEGGGLVVALLIVDPFFDGTAATAYGQDLATSRNDSASLSFEAPRDGDFVIIIQASSQAGGDYYLEVTGEAGVLRDCTVEPLSILAYGTWTASSESSENPLVEIQVGCHSYMAISTLGAVSVERYNVDRDLNFAFVLGDSLFTTVSLSAEEWVIAREDGTEYTLTNNANPACQEGILSELIRGAWLFSERDQFVLNFTCDDTAILVTPDGEVSLPYRLEEGVLIFAEGTDTEFSIEEIAIEEGVFVGMIDGDEFTMEDVNPNR